jgi:hypothetical protein
MDSDSDGLLLSQEVKIGTSDNTADTDGDGIDDLQEVYKYFTNPLLVDTDMDGILDSDFGERIENANAEVVSVWSRYMGNANHMDTLYQDVQEVIYDDGILLKIKVVIFPEVTIPFDASIFDHEDDIKSLMGNYPQSVLSESTKSKFLDIAGEGSPYNRANRVRGWFIGNVLYNDMLPQDGWRRNKPNTNLGEYSIDDFIFRELKPGFEFADPYTRRDGNFRYFMLTKDGEEIPVEIPNRYDEEWEFINRWWFWKLWPVEMQFAIQRTGDCGPTSIFLASLYQAVGIPARLIFETATSSEMGQHFYPEIYINGHWISADPSPFDLNRPKLGERIHTSKTHAYPWVQWDYFDGAWLIENNNYTQWAFRFRDNLSVRHGSLDDTANIDQDFTPDIEYPLGFEQ